MSIAEQDNFDFSINVRIKNQRFLVEMELLRDLTTHDFLKFCEEYTASSNWQARALNMTGGGIQLVDVSKDAIRDIRFDFGYTHDAIKAGASWPMDEGSSNNSLAEKWLNSPAQLLAPQGYTFFAVFETMWESGNWEETELVQFLEVLEKKCGLKSVRYGVRSNDPYGVTPGIVYHGLKMST